MFSPSSNEAHGVTVLNSGGAKYTKRFGSSWLLFRASTAWLELALAIQCLSMAGYLFSGKLPLMMQSQPLFEHVVILLIVLNIGTGLGMLACILSVMRCSKCYAMLLLFGAGLSGADAGLLLIGWHMNLIDWYSVTDKLIDALLFFFVAFRGLIRWTCKHGQ